MIPWRQWLARLATAERQRRLRLQRGSIRTRLFATCIRLDEARRYVDRDRAAERRERDRLILQRQTVRDRLTEVEQLLRTYLLTQQILDAEQAKARETEAALSEATRKAADAYRSDLARRSAAAAAVRVDRDRLLDSVAVAPGACPAGAGAAAASGADGAAALRVVVRECAAALSKVAEAADASDVRLRGLQDYVRATRP